MSKKKRLIILLSVIVVIAAVILTVQYRRHWSHSDPSFLSISGNIEVRDAEISFKIAGRVVDRLVSEGELAKTGQIVARLDSSDLIQEVALRKAEFRATQASLDELEAGSRPEETDAAQARLQNARVNAAHLRIEFDRQSKLLKGNTISQREFDRAQSEYERAIAHLKEIQANLELLKKGPRKETIEQARARVEQAKAAHTMAEIRLSYTTITTPFSGIVLSENVEPGEYVAPGTPVVTLGDLENVWLRAYINETDLGRVKLGQLVRVTTDTYPGKIYEGRISFISSEAEFTPKNVQTEKERVKLVYRVKIDIPNPSMELKPGMPADAKIVLDQEIK